MNRYMNFVAKAKHDHKSVTHVDGTARVQLVEKDCESIIRPILEEWYEKTGCPMLLNTSLNIKGKPIVNTWEHANDFQKNTKVKVFKRWKMRYHLFMSTFKKRKDDQERGVLYDE